MENNNQFMDKKKVSKIPKKRGRRPSAKKILPPLPMETSIVAEVQEIIVPEKRKRVPKALEAVAEIQNSMKTYWPWSEKQSKGNPFSQVENKEVFPEINAAKSSLNSDKSMQFSAILSELFLYAVSWFPVTLDSWIIGMRTDGIAFRRGFATTQKWAELFSELRSIDGIYVTGFADQMNSNISTFQVSVYEPKLLQAVDFKIQKVIELEYDEYIERLKSPLSNNTGFEMF